MGYLDKFLRNNPQQTISCDDVYPRILKVKHATGILQIAIAESDLSVSLLVKEMVPDVEEWQYAGDINGFYIFKFHNASDRDNARAYLTSLGYTTEVRDYLK